MKNQALFSSKDKSKQLKCRLLQFLFGALWVNIVLSTTYALQSKPHRERGMFMVQPNRHMAL